VLLSGRKKKKGVDNKVSPLPRPDRLVLFSADLGAKTQIFLNMEDTSFVSDTEQRGKGGELGTLQAAWLMNRGWAKPDDERAD